MSSPYQINNRNHILLMRLLVQSKVKINKDPLARREPSSFFPRRAKTTKEEPSGWSKRVDNTLPFSNEFRSSQGNGGLVLSSKSWAGSSSDIGRAAVGRSIWKMLDEFQDLIHSQKLLPQELESVGDLLFLIHEEKTEKTLRVVVCLE
jgi:hypothetical protein